MADQLDEIGMSGRDLVDTVNRVQVKGEYAFDRPGDQVARIIFAQESRSFCIAPA